MKKIVVFTDLVDYTLKSSLLTPKQLKEFIIDKQDKIILPILKKYNGELVKYIGDSYLLLFNNIDNSINFSIELQKNLEEYNKNIKFNLKKIELKIVLHYGKISEKNTILGKEYFGDTINIASRILEKTPKNRIFITYELFQNIKNNKIEILDLGKYSFRGVIYKINLSEIIYTKNLIGDSKELLLGKKDFNLEYKKIKEIDEIIFKFSSVAFLLTIQPIPLIDNYFLVLLHLYLLKEIAKKYGIDLREEQIKEIIKTIFLSIGGIYGVNQVLIGISKIGLPVIGGYLMAPTNFALTYGLGKVFSNYFYYEEQKEILTNQNIKDIFLGSKDRGIKIAKKQKNEIIETGKKYKKAIFKKLDNFKGLLSDIKKYIK